MRARLLRSPLAPHCATCRERSRCEATGTRPEYPRCRTPVRRTSLAAVEALLRWAAERHGLASDPAFEAFLGALVARHRLDRERYSEILEPSLSVDAGGTHHLRLSYSFPGYRADPSAREALLALATPFGAARATFARLLGAALDERVEHVLFGLSWDAPHAFRVKLYFQLRDEASEAARAAFAARTLSVPPDAIPRGPVHLVAIDHGAAGVVGARAYLCRPAQEARGDLAALPGPLRGALDIHRMTGPASLEPSPSERDFALAESGLSFAELLRLCPAVSALWARAPCLPVAAAVRRVSLGASASRVTAYYVLTAEDP